MNKIKIKNDIKDNMKGEYIIINKASLKKELTNLLKQREVEPDNYQQSYLNGKIKQMQWVLSQKSTPLITEIEKAFDAGSENPRIGGSYPMFEMEKEQNNAKQFYILNLKI